MAELADAAVMILLEGATPNRITHNYLLNIAGLISSQSSYRFKSCPDYLNTGEYINWLDYVLWEHEVVGSSPASPTMVCIERCCEQLG